MDDYSDMNVPTPMQPPMTPMAMVGTPMQPASVRQATYSTAGRSAIARKLHLNNLDGAAGASGTQHHHIGSKMPTQFTTYGQSSVSSVGIAATPGGSSLDSTPMPQLQNIVSTVNLGECGHTAQSVTASSGCKLDLKTIALRARNAEYNPKRFAAVIMRIREPRTTALIFGWD